MQHSAAIPTQPAAETWQEIEGLVEDVAKLSKAEISTRQFYAELLERAVRAVAAVGGAVWLRNSQGQWDLEYQIRFVQILERNDQSAQAQHLQLLDMISARGEATVVSPRSGPGDVREAENPTDHLLVLCPIVIDDESVGVVELFQQPDKSPAVQRGNIQLTTILCELAADFHRNWHLRQMREREVVWNEYDQFVWRIHQGLDLERTAYAAANEGRRFISCDRLSVLTVDGRRCRLCSISGLEAFDRRAGFVGAMERLAQCVVRTGRPLWYRGETTAQDRSTQTGLDAYLQESPAQLLGVVPLSVLPVASGSADTTAVIGALVVEQFHDDDTASEKIEQRTAAIARHCAAALHNARSFSRLPLLPLQRALDKISWCVQLRQLPLTVLVSVTVALAIAVLVLVPARFEIEARGQLRPVHTENVFAPYDGTVVDLPLFTDVAARDETNGVRVTRGAVVARLQNTDLDYELSTVLGEFATVKSQRDTITSTLKRLAGRRTSPDEEARFNELSAKQAELEVLVESLNNRLEILRRQQTQLSVAATIDGQIQTWDVVQKLESRPVRRGQHLMTIVDSAGPWVAEIHVPDKHIGYVLSARQQRGQDLDVSFILKSDPSTTYRGKIDEVAMATEIDHTEGATVLVTVNVDANQLTDPRPGTTVIANIHCGRRSLGYVWLHDVIDYARSRILF